MFDDAHWQNNEFFVVVVFFVFCCFCEYHEFLESLTSLKYRCYVIYWIWEKLWFLKCLSMIAFETHILFLLFNWHLLVFHISFHPFRVSPFHLPSLLHPVSCPRSPSLHLFPFLSILLCYPFIQFLSLLFLESLSSSSSSPHSFALLCSPLHSLPSLSPLYLPFLFFSSSSLSLFFFAKRENYTITFNYHQQ